MRAGVFGVLCVLTTVAALSAQEPSSPSTVFRAGRELVSIDVVVRDRQGNLVRNLRPEDFDVREDGRGQDILTTSYQEVRESGNFAPDIPLLQRLGQAPLPSVTVTAPDLAGRRLMLLLFDLSAMEPEEVERGVNAALRYVDTRMTSADLFAVASLTWELTLLTDFTGDRETVRSVLEQLVAVDVSTGTAATDDPTNAPSSDEGGGQRPVAATDARLRALRLLADSLAPIAQKKALLYFTAGLANAAQDTPAELRAATTAAARANLAIYPVDTRGLQAVIPSGPARIASRPGEGLFSGSDVNDQFTDLAASQDTMASVAASTGGRMFSGVNDPGEAFDRVQRDTAGYYLLGYSTTNQVRDGRFRRVEVRVKGNGLRVEARSGYYAEKDFVYTTRAEREALLEESLRTPPPASSFSVEASSRWRHEGLDRFSVPFALSLPRPTDATGRNALDVLAIVKDEQGRIVARLRDSVDLPANASEDAVNYASRVELPAGRFTLRAAVRENGSGGVAVTETEISLPTLHALEGLGVSPPAIEPRSGGTWAITADVYERATTDPRPLVASLALFKNSVRVYENALIETTASADRARGARAFMLTMPANAVPRGRYICQITVVNAATRQFSTMRTQVDVR